MNRKVGWIRCYRRSILTKVLASSGGRNTAWVQKPTAGASNGQSVPPRPSRTSLRNRNLPTSRPATDQLRPVQRNNERRPSGSGNIPATIGKPSVNPSAQDGHSGAAPPRVASVSPPEQPSSPILSAVARMRVTESPSRSSTPASPNVPESDVGSSIDPESQILPTPPSHVVHSIPPGLSHPAYQISTPAQELLDDARSRRDVPLIPSSPFPEFDRTLENLGRTDFNFKWTMNLNLTSGNTDTSDEYRGNFDPFSGSTSRTMHNNEHRIPHISTPPGLMSSPKLTQVNAQPVNGYRGQFNPFADMDDDSLSQINESRDGSRQESRFGFARKKTSPSINGFPSFNTFVPPPSSSSDSPPLIRPQFGMSWPHGLAPRSTLNSPPLYSAPPPGMSYEYPINPSVLNMGSAVAELRRERQPSFPPGLNFQPFDNIGE